MLLGQNVGVVGEVASFFASAVAFAFVFAVAVIPGDRYLMSLSIRFAIWLFGGELDLDTDNLRRLVKVFESTGRSEEFALATRSEVEGRR